MNKHRHTNVPKKLYFSCSGQEINREMYHDYIKDTDIKSYCNSGLNNIIQFRCVYDDTNYWNRLWRKNA